MEEVVLQAKTRTVIGKQVRALRRQGLLPGVVYGHHIDPIPVSLNLHDINRILPGVSSSQLIKIDIDGEQYPALVRDKQRHPVTGGLIHVDFQAVSLTENIRAMVGLEFKGEAPAVKNFDGIVVFSREELEVECLPGDLLDHIEVDITGLKEIGDAIHVRDIILPSNVTVLEDPGEIVVVITAQEYEAEAEEAEVVEAGAPEPEVIERGKKEEEDF